MTTNVLSQLKKLMPLKILTQEKN